jgi:phage tail tape-measure protein
VTIDLTTITLPPTIELGRYRTPVEVELTAFGTGLPVGAGYRVVLTTRPRDRMTPREVISSTILDHEMSQENVDAVIQALAQSLAQVADRHAADTLRRQGYAV